MSLFNDDSFVFFIYGLDGFEGVVLEIEVQGPESILNLSYFSEAKVDEVMVMCSLDLLLVEFHFVLHEY